MCVCHHEVQWPERVGVGCGLGWVCWGGILGCVCDIVVVVVVVVAVWGSIGFRRCILYPFLGL